MVMGVCVGAVRLLSRGGWWVGVYGYGCVCGCCEAAVKRWVVGGGVWLWVCVDAVRLLSRGGCGCMCGRCEAAVKRWVVGGGVWLWVCVWTL